MPGMGASLAGFEKADTRESFTDKSQTRGAETPENRGTEGAGFAALANSETVLRGDLFFGREAKDIGPQTVS